MRGKIRRKILCLCLAAMALAMSGCTGKKPNASSGREQMPAKIEEIVSREENGKEAAKTEKTVSQTESGKEAAGAEKSSQGKSDAESKDERAERVKKGKTLFQGTCSACHAPDAKGIKGLGADLTTSEFVKTRSDDELLEFLKVGRRANDPANKSGVEMPARGGNPSLTDENLRDIIAFIRSIARK